VPDLNEARGIVEREWAQEHCVHYAEDGGIGSDAQSQYDDGGCRKSGIFQQNTETVFEIR
jgi:hypothetical protein